MSTVLPGGLPARAGEPPGGSGSPSEGGAARPATPVPDTGAAAAPAPPGPAGASRVRTAPRERLAGWPGPLRVPLQVLGATLAKAWRDRVLGLSAEAAFWQILSVPPLLIGLVGSLGYLADVLGGAAVRQVEERLLEGAGEVLTDDVVTALVAPTLTDILGSGRLELVSVGFLLALWAGSSATATFMNTIVIAYDQRDVRGPIRTRLKALWLFVVGLLLAVLMLPLLVLGQDVLVDLLPAQWRDTGTMLINGAYWPFVLVGLFLALTSFYHVVLADRLPWWRHLLGAALAVSFFALAALVLRAYVTDILTSALPYGALATPIAALMFCFLFGLAVLLGAELNTTVQQRWPAPLRRHGSRRRSRRAAKLAAEARRLGLF